MSEFGFMAHRQKILPTPGLEGPLRLFWHEDHRKSCAHKNL